MAVGDVTGMELATAYVSIVSSTRDLAPSVAKSMAGVPAVSQATGLKSGKALSAGLGLGLKALGAIGAAIAVGDFVSDSIAEARESQKVGAITTQIIKSTGGAAKITADQVGDLAQSISNKTGKDDELIQSGANLLLTFKNVRNEAGEGANIFDRATQAAVDLSAAGFGSVESGSKMLGKALNDPLKGITALSRAGVTFSDQQKEQIKTMVESGNVLGAQKIILKEVESQVGGTAAASATAGEKMSVAWGNVKETVGTQLLPALDAIQSTAATVLTWLIENIPKWFNWLMGYLRPWFETAKALFRDALALIKGLWNSFGKDIIAFLKQTWDFIGNLIRGAFDIVRGIFKVALSLLKGDWSGVWNGLGQIVRGAWTIIWGALKWLLQQIGTVLAAGWKLLTDGATAAFKGLLSGISSVWNGLKNLLAGPIDRALQFVQENIIDKINGLFSFLHLPLHISPIWVDKGSASVRSGIRHYSGGWTANVPWTEPAGIVHGQEFVVRARAAQRLKQDAPGLLEALNGYLGGGWVNPVGVKPGFPWGRYPSGGFHPALDFPARRGTPVRYPMARGFVLRDGWDTGGFGTHIRTADNDGNFTILGHMLREIVSEGQNLIQGQLIGYVDSTGNSTGDHLHMERRRSPYIKGTAFNFTSNQVGGTAGGFLSEIVRGLFSNLINGVTSPLKALGWVGQMFGGVVKSMLSGLVSLALNALGMGGATFGAFDQGGWLAPGMNLAWNGLGRPERVPGPNERLLTDDDLQAIEDAVARGAQRGVQERAREVRRQIRAGATT